MFTQNKQFHLIAYYVVGNDTIVIWNSKTAEVSYDGDTWGKGMNQMDVRKLLLDNKTIRLGLI